MNPSEPVPKNVSSSAPPLAPAFKMDDVLAREYVEFLKNFPRQKQICICGHTINSHNYSTSMGWECKPGNIWCECPNPEAVYFASDSRHFMRSTHGIGMKHALGLGIATLKSKNGHGEWLIELKCAVPDCRNLEVVIACVNRDGQVLAKSSPNSVFLCGDHAWNFGGSRL